MSLIFAVSSGVYYQSEVMNSIYGHHYLSDYFSDYVSSLLIAEFVLQNCSEFFLMFDIVIIVPEFCLLEKFADIIGCLIVS